MKKETLDKQVEEMIKEARSERIAELKGALSGGAVLTDEEEKLIKGIIKAMDKYITYLD